MKIVLATAGWLLFQPHPQLPNKAIYCDHKVIATSKVLKGSRARFFWQPLEFNLKAHRVVSSKTFNRLVKTKECIK